MAITKEYLEEAAAKTVAYVLSAEYELHDTGSRSGAYDFTIVGDGTSVALEITQATDLATEKFYGAIEKYGESFEGEGLETHWMVAVDAPSSDFRARDLKRLQQELVKMISALEAEGRTSFDCHLPKDEEREVCATYDFIKFGNTIDMDGRPEVRLNHVPVVSFGQEDYVEVAEARAHLEDNRAKLAKSGLDRRHLFVWVNVWELGAAAAFAVGAPPQRAPDLPAEVTDLWVGRFVEDRTQAWHFGEGKWTYHEVDMEKQS